VTLSAKVRITVDVAMPLIAQSTNPQDKVKELTELYAQDYAMHWPDIYTSMRWNFLDHHLKLPVE
jgi:hypothetical protein